MVTSVSDISHYPGFIIEMVSEVDDGNLLVSEQTYYIKQRIQLDVLFNRICDPISPYWGWT